MINIVVSLIVSILCLVKIIHYCSLMVDWKDNPWVDTTHNHTAYLEWWEKKNKDLPLVDWEDLK